MSAVEEPHPDAIKDAMAALCMCDGCKRLRHDLEALILEHFNEGAQPADILASVAAVYGTTVGQWAEVGRVDVALADDATIIRTFADLSHYRMSVVEDSGAMTAPGSGSRQ